MAKRLTTTKEPRVRRHARIRAKVAGTPARPRLCVFRSARHITAQLIDDRSGKTLVAASDRDVASVPAGDASRGAKVAVAFAVGKALAERAVAKHIAAVVFDRGGYAYHGRVRALAEGAREGGLDF